MLRSSQTQTAGTMKLVLVVLLVIVLDATVVSWLSVPDLLRSKTVSNEAEFANVQFSYIASRNVWTLPVMRKQ